MSETWEEYTPEDRARLRDVNERRRMFHISHAIKPTYDHDPEGIRLGYECKDCGAVVAVTKASAVVRFHPMSPCPKAKLPAWVKDVSLGGVRLSHGQVNLLHSMSVKDRVEILLTDDELSDVLRYYASSPFAYDGANADLVHRLNIITSAFESDESDNTKTETPQ